MSQPWRWAFRTFGISPRGNRKDKYFTVIGMAVLFAHSGMVIAVNRGQPFGFMRAITAIMYYTSLILFIAYNHKYPQRSLEFERDLRRADRELRELCKIEIGTSPIHQSVIVWAVFLLILLLVYSLLMPVYLVALLWIGYLIVCVPLLQQVLLVNLVNDRFSVLNEHLARTVIGPDTPDILDQVFRIHSSLHALIADVDSHFCFNILLLFTAMFLTWIQNMYNILLAISGVEGIGLYLNQYRVVLVTCHFLLLVMSCHSCSRTGNRTVLIAHRLLQPDTDLSIWDQVRMFSALVTDNKVHLTVGGVFTLDRGLVTKTALTALSYLVVAIQLRDVQVFGDDTDTANVTMTTV